MPQKLSLIFFLLLFPGLFFYSSALTAGVIPAILGGGFGAIASLSLLMLFPVLVKDLASIKGKSFFITMCFFALIAYTLFWLFVHHYLGKDYQTRPEVLNQYLTLVSSWLVLFCIGFYWPLTMERSYIVILSLCLVGITLITLLNVDFSRLILIFGVSDIEGSLSYQGLARSTAVLGLVLVSVSKNIYHLIIVSILLLISLFFIGARSELVGIIAVLPLVYLWYFKEKPLISFLIFLILAASIISLIGFNYDALSTSRQFQLSDIFDSTSGAARVKLHYEALEAIKMSPVLGDFSGQIRENSSIGSYAHNFFSAWRQLGLLGFLLYFILLFFPFTLSLRFITKRNYPKSDLPRIILISSFFSLVLLIAAKPVFWFFPALTWGLLASYYRQRRNYRRAYFSKN